MIQRPDQPEKSSMTTDPQQSSSPDIPCKSDLKGACLTLSTIPSKTALADPGIDKFVHGLAYIVERTYNYCVKDIFVAPTNKDWPERKVIVRFQKYKIGIIDEQYAELHQDLSNVKEMERFKESELDIKLKVEPYKYRRFSISHELYVSPISMSHVFETYKNVQMLEIKVTDKNSTFKGRCASFGIFRSTSDLTNPQNKSFANIDNVNSFRKAFENKLQEGFINNIESLHFGGDDVMKRPDWFGNNVKERNREFIPMVVCLLSRPHKMLTKLNDMIVDENGQEYTFAHIPFKHNTDPLIPEKLISFMKLKYNYKVKPMGKFEVAEESYNSIFKKEFFKKKVEGGESASKTISSFSDKGKTKVVSMNNNKASSEVRDSEVNFDTTNYPPQGEISSFSEGDPFGEEVNSKDNITNAHKSLIKNFSDLGLTIPEDVYGKPSVKETTKMELEFEAKNLQIMDKITDESASPQSKKRKLIKMSKNTEVIKLLSIYQSVEEEILSGQNIEGRGSVDEQDKEPEISQICKRVLKENISRGDVKEQAAYHTMVLDRKSKAVETEKRIKGFKELNEKEETTLEMDIAVQEDSIKRLEEVKRREEEVLRENDLQEEKMERDGLTKAEIEAICGMEGRWVRNGLDWLDEFLNETVVKLENLKGSIEDFELSLKQLSNSDEKEETTLEMDIAIQEGLIKGIEEVKGMEEEVLREIELQVEKMERDGLTKAEIEAICGMEGRWMRNGLDWLDEFLNETVVKLENLKNS